MIDEPLQQDLFILASVSFLYFLHVLIEEVKNVLVVLLPPVSFHMVIPGAPWHYRKKKVFTLYCKQHPNGKRQKWFQTLQAGVIHCRWITVGTYTLLAWIFVRIPPMARVQAVSYSCNRSNSSSLGCLWHCEPRRWSYQAGEKENTVLLSNHPFHNVQSISCSASQIVLPCICFPKIQVEPTERVDVSL